MKYRVEIQYDRGRQYMDVEADDDFEATRKALEVHPAAFCARVVKQLEAA
jgi:hypothetical protein